MPFNIFGERIEPEEPKKTLPKHPVKVRSEKRRGKFVTVIYNLPLEKEDLRILASKLKQELGCGGTVKGDKIELQGSIVDKVQLSLKNQGIKA